MGVDAMPIDKVYNFVSGLRWCAVENLRKTLVHYMFDVMLVHGCESKAKINNTGQCACSKPHHHWFERIWFKSYADFGVIVYNVAIWLTPSIFYANASKL